MIYKEGDNVMLLPLDNDRDSYLGVYSRKHWDIGATRTVYSLAYRDHESYGNIYKLINTSNGDDLLVREIAIRPKKSQNIYDIIG